MTFDFGLELAVMLEHVKWNCFELVEMLQGCFADRMIRCVRTQVCTVVVEILRRRTPTAMIAPVL